MMGHLKNRERLKIMTHPATPFFYTRKDYIQNNACTHEQYYRQLVKQGLVEIVKGYFGMEALMSPRNDGHFNHIALKKWDRLAYNNHMPTRAEWESVGDFPTQAGFVCVLKQAAAMAVEQEKAGE